MIYIKKIFNQDIKNQIAVTKDPSLYFFNQSIEEGKERNIVFHYFSLNGEEQNNPIKASIKGYRIECRINGEFKGFLEKNFKLEAGDIVAFKDRAKDDFNFTYIKKANIINDIHKVFEIFDDNHCLYDESNIIQNSNTELDSLSRNRIIFGAPGTGKSHKLSLEAGKYFSVSSDKTDIKQQLYKEIHSQPSDSDQAEWITYLGIKYSSYIFDNYINPKKQNELVTDFALLEGDNQTTKKKEQLVQGAKAGYRLKLNLSIKEDNSHIERVTFHPNYSYAQFVGTYKPVMHNTGEVLDKTTSSIIEILKDSSLDAQSKYDKLFPIFDNIDKKYCLDTLMPFVTDDVYIMKNKDGTPNPNLSKNNKLAGIALRNYLDLKKNSNHNSEITYSYIPGPFMRVYVNAKRNPEKKFLLLIEEINRANVAAVFGDVFQLLDRKSDGTSQYPISASEDQKNYLESCGILEDEIAIPANMYIWATMNSADQGVLPMDAAFKRRWDFEYLDIDNEDAVNQIKDIEIPISRDGKKTVKWNDFRTQLNDKLSDIGINEDKLLGPFFLAKKSLENAMNNPEKFIELFESKVIMYLFEDVVKMQPGKLFITGTRRFSKICKEFEEKGMELFGINVEVTEV